MRILAAHLVVLVLTAATLAQTSYRLPPQEVVEIIDAPPPPSVDISPSCDAMLLIDYRPHPSIELLAKPIQRIAGLRIDPQIRARQRLTEYVRFTVKGKANRQTSPSGSGSRHRRTPSGG